MLGYYWIDQSEDYLYLLDGEGDVLCKGRLSPRSPSDLFFYIDKDSDYCWNIPMEADYAGKIRTPFIPFGLIPQVEIRNSEGRLLNIVSLRVPESHYR